MSALLYFRPCRDIYIWGVISRNIWADVIEFGRALFGTFFMLWICG